MAKINLMAIQEPTRYCLWCNDPLRGRSDKKFCDASCRNAFNNQLDHSVALVIKTINYALRRNRNILAELFQLAGDKGIIPTAVLQYKGFQFQYHTEILQPNSPAPIFISYDFGYQSHSDGQIKIIPISKESLSAWYETTPHNP